MKKKAVRKSSIEVQVVAKGKRERRNAQNSSVKVCLGKERTFDVCAERNSSHSLVL